MELDKTYYVYLLANKHQTVIYTGKTSDLQRRVAEHKLKLFPKSFTARYTVDQLVHFEGFETNEEASYREHQIKAGSRQKKTDLIVQNNPEWKDLSKDWDSFY
ncbi:MAG: GIY-YIG nuclease family protein [Balneolaceae bacterium]